MVTVTSLDIANGAVTWHDAVEPGRTDPEGAPAFFEVAFMLDAESEVDGLKVRNIFHLRTRVVGLSPDTPWSEVEARAAGQLATLLDGIARGAAVRPKIAAQV